mgnify:CR=1 FL=1
MTAKATVEKKDEPLAVERAVLACALMDGKAAALLAERGVKPDWFRDLRCRELAATVRDFLVAGKPIEVLALADDLQKRRKAWGPSFCEKLYAEEGAIAAHAEYYVERLADFHFKESAFSMLADAQLRLDSQEDEKPETTVSRLATDLAALLRWHTDSREPNPHQVREKLVDSWVQSAEDVKAGKPARAMGLPWGIDGLDFYTQGLYPGLHIVAARPSFGKTMLENYLVRGWLMAGKRVARASLDMTPEALAARALTLMSGESLDRLRGGHMTASDEAKVRAACEVTRSWRERILTENTAEEIVSRARAIQAADGLDVLTVDYVQLVGTTEQTRFMNDNQAISRAMKVLKAFANETGTPVLLLSQLSRAVEREDREPQLSDLRDSGSIEQEAKTVTFVYPEPTVMQSWMAEEQVTDWKALPIRPGVLNVLKNQDGATGAVCVRQYAKHGVYEECARVGKEAREELKRQMREEAQRVASEKKAGRKATYKDPTPPEIRRGYDFRKARPGTANLYCVVKHEKGAYEVLRAAELPAMNAAAEALGIGRWTNIQEVEGLQQALAALVRVKREHGIAPDGDELEGSGAGAPEAPAEPVHYEREPVDPDSPFAGEV